MSPRNVVLGDGAMLYTFPGGRQVQVDVVARLQMNPGAFDDGEGSIFVGQLPTGFIVFVQAGTLPDGAHFAEYSDQRAALAFALEVAKLHVESWLEHCAECDSAALETAARSAVIAYRGYQLAANDSSWCFRGHPSHMWSAPVPTLAEAKAAIDAELASYSTNAAGRAALDGGYSDEQAEGEDR